MIDLLPHVWQTQWFHLPQYAFLGISSMLMCAVTISFWYCFKTLNLLCIYNKHNGFILHISIFFHVNVHQLDHRVNKAGRTSGVINNHEEGHRYAEHGLRKFLRYRNLQSSQQWTISSPVLIQSEGFQPRAAQNGFICLYWTDACVNRRYLSDGEVSVRCIMTVALFAKQEQNQPRFATLHHILTHLSLAAILLPFYVCFLLW